MKFVQSYIKCKQVELSSHAFFHRLKADRHIGEVLPFASKLTFWVMVFQDVLQLNTRRITHPTLSRIARHHLAEDAGHDRWFLNDLLAIDGKHPDISQLFGKSHASTRHAAYALVAEVFKAQDDEERIVLLLTLESAGHVFFERIVDFFEAHDVRRSLKYFSRHHLDAEKSHEMFERQLEALLAAVVLSGEMRERCLALLDRCYAAFQVIFDELEETIVEAKAGLPIEAVQGRASILINREQACFEHPAIPEAA